MRITLRDLTRDEMAELTNPEFLDEVLEGMPSIRDHIIRQAARKAQWRRQHAAPLTGCGEHNAALCDACRQMRAQDHTTVGGLR